MAAWWAAAWVQLSCFGLSVVSALVPWVNAEAILLAFAASARSRRDLVALVLITTAGQMVGKCALFYVSRRASSRYVHADAGDARMQRWRRRLGESPRGSLALIFVSSVVGVPPFYVVTIVAGACRTGLAGFIGAGTAGRLVRFAALVAVPRLLLSTLG